jgi:hypothetical protein
MIAATIGRTFLTAYNERYKENLSPKEFFKEKYLPLFYGSSKYMQWITNSPFVQGLSKEPNGVYGVREKIKDVNDETLKFQSKQEARDYFNKYVICREDYLYCYEEKISVKGIEFIKKLSNVEQRKIADTFFEKVKKASLSDQYDGSIAIGFPASEVDEFNTTSGQVADLKLEFNEDDVYYSWIGSGLGVGVEGGYSIFFHHEEILCLIYEGWEVYRNLLNDKSVSVNGRQIDTWNGQWLCYRSHKRDIENAEYYVFQNHDFFTIDKGVVKLNTVFWAKLFFNLSANYDKTSVVGYVYNYADTNKTLGFYPFYFSQAQKALHVYKKLFGEQAVLDDARIYESLFGVHLKLACELGSIGLQALEPKDLRKYYGNDSTLKLIKSQITKKKGESEEDYKVRESSVKQKDYKKLITFRTYKTWLLAMITKNKEESLEYTAEVAEALHEYRKGATKNDRKNLIQSELLVAKTKKSFLDALTTLIKDVNESKLEMFKSLRDKVHLMSPEDFGYFVVLLKFDYAFAERERN